MVKAPAIPLLDVVKVVERVLPFHSIGAVARHDDVTAAGDLLRKTAPIGSCSTGYSYDSKGIAYGGVMITWRYVAHLVHAGLTPGNLAAYTEACVRWRALHDEESWWVPHPDYMASPKFLAQCNAVNDPLAYEMLWWPEYLRITDLMRAVEHDVMFTAYDVLTTESLVDQQLTLALG